MPRWLRVTLVTLVGLLVVAGVALLVVYRASQHVPEFYRAAIEADPQSQKKAADKVFDQATTLNSDVQREGRWLGVFTAEDINGWLAVELPRSHPDAMPAEVRDPRVAIEPDGITVACQATRDGLSSVLTIKVDVYVPEVKTGAHPDSSNQVALRIRKARVGKIPWPLDRVLRAISRAAQQAELPLQWLQADGDPVALITIHPRQRGKTIHIEKIELESGRISIAGTTERSK
jgi:hypothetical protein